MRLPAVPCGAEVLTLQPGFQGPVTDPKEVRYLGLSAAQLRQLLNGFEVQFYFGADRPMCRAFSFCHLGNRLRPG